MRAAGLSCEARSSTSEVGMCCVAESNAVDGDVRCALVCERIESRPVPAARLLAYHRKWLLWVTGTIPFT